jgi:hypothetical protein
VTLNQACEKPKNWVKDPTFNSQFFAGSFMKTASSLKIFNLKAYVLLIAKF